jgi:tetratricopeptide (TPR) repeat protein
MASFTTENAKPERILVSWKEIAAFLNRAERTAKRWERERGLPVHRVPGGERGGVYAYPSELTDWLSGKSSELEVNDPASSDQETSIRSETGAPGAEAPSEGQIDPRPVEIAVESPMLRSARWARFLAIGMAAALAGTGIYAGFTHSFGSWILRRLPVLAAIGEPGLTRQVAAPVSDAEKRVAHDLYLKGRFEWNQRTPDTLNRALDDFTQSIVHNPNDALAYAGLADAYEMLFIYGSRQDDDARDRAMAAARKAVELDATLPVAHRALGYGLWRSRNFAEAEKELHLAIQLDPKDPLAHLWLSNVLANQGREAECLAEIDEAQELDPASASILAMKGERLYLDGKKKEGIAFLNAAIRSEPRLSIAHLYLAQIEFLERQFPAYLRESQKAAEIRNDAWLKEVTAKLSAAYAQDGERGLLNAGFAVEENCNAPIYRWGAVTRTERAIECLNWDRRSEALQLLEEANANHEKDFEDLRAGFTSSSPPDLHEPFSKLADEPRFQALMKQKADLPKSAKLPTSTDSGTL